MSVQALARRYAAALADVVTARGESREVREELAALETGLDADGLPSPNVLDVVPASGLDLAPAELLRRVSGVVGTALHGDASMSVLYAVIRRIWELGNPGILFSYPKEEGKFLGEAAPRRLPPGRAQLVTRRGVRLMQTGHVSGAGR